MATRGAKVERHSVSDQPHELKYEANKTGASTARVLAAKKDSGTNQRTNVEQKLQKK